MLSAVPVPLAEFEKARGERPVAVTAKELWVAGSLGGLERPVIAIVGTRGATGYGTATAKRLARELGAAGCCILSGLALGIDGAAHAAALEAGAVTIGVLGGGHERFFPRRHRDLAERMIAAGGAVLSPFAPDRDAYPSQFLQRNAVVAGLADAVVVVEAPARSGALNTAGWAAGRIPVFAVPGDVDRPHSAGCHALLRDGATLARDARDILADLRLTGATAQPSAETQVPLADIADDDCRALAQALANGEASLDDLAAARGGNIARVMTALSLLELDGVVEARPGGRYALTRAAAAARC